MNPDRLLALFEPISEAPDAISRLRRFILDLAVRGKLEEQDPEDEPAEELIRLISTEKARLAQAGKIKRLKPLPPLTEEEVLEELPKGWSLSRLGCLIDLISGQHLQPSEYSENPADGLPYITGPSDFSPGGICVTRYSLVRKAVAFKGQLLLTVKGSGVGKTAICDIQEVAISRQLMALTAIGWNDHYLALITHRLAVKLQSEARSLIPGISREDVENFVLPLPPLAEQHRIVAKVNELMALCDRLEAARQQREQYRDRLVAASLQRLNQPSDDPDTFRSDARFALQVLPSLTSTPAQIKQLRQTILNLAVRGKLVEQDPEDEPADEQLARIIEAKILLDRRAPTAKKKRSELSDESLDFPFPARWTSAPLSDLVTVLNGRAYKQSELLDTGTPVLRVGNLFTSNKWYYSDLELDDDKYCDDGDLIFAWSASFGPFIWNGGRAIYHYHIWKLPLHSPEDLSRDYLYLYLLNKTDEIKASGHGISMVHMTKEKMERLEVPLPPLAEQHRIVAKVNELMALCDQLEQQLSQGEQSRRRLLEAVLQEALAGRLPERPEQSDAAL
jgi:type I restriction enzyme S subunit